VTRAARILFDTSVLVPATLGSHEQHPLALRWLAEAIAGKFKLVVAAHSIAETYATLTRLPPPHRVSPDRAALLIRSNVIERARALITTLEPEDYVSVIAEASARSIAGGALYDVLIARAARKAKARILTFNTGDFRRLCSDPERDLVPL
jgi:predicted nucleic acid-binding protein